MMRKRIVRIGDEKARGGIFGASLEEKARELATTLSAGRWDSSALSVIEREVVLTLEQIERLREVHVEQRKRLLRLECYADTELMQMEERTPRYSPYRFPEREKLQRRLISIEHDRMQLALRESVELRELRGRLLYLLNDHTRLMRRWTLKDSPGNWNR